MAKPEPAKPEYYRMAYRHLRLSAFLIATFMAHPLIGSAIASELFDATRSGDIDRVLQLLESGANPNERSPYDGPLHVAARLGSTEIVVDLLDAGADLELPGFGGVHPLHAAALANRKRIVSVLLTRGAKVDALDNLGRTALLSALSGAEPDLETLKVLLDAGANPNLLDGAAQIYPLDYAAMAGRADVTELLIKSRANVNAKVAGTGQSVLHFAIAHCHASSDGNIGVVQVLVDHGADVNAKDANGSTPLDFANFYAPNNGLLHHILVKAGAT